MLDVFRKNKKGIFGILIAGFVAAMMVPFGMDYSHRAERENTAVGIKVAGIEIPGEEYFHRLSQWQSMMRRQLGENYNQLSGMLNLPQRAIDELINGVILNKLSESIGLGVGSAQMLEKLSTHPFFDGKITPAAYEEFLSQQGITGVAFEEMSAQQIVTEQLQAMVSDLNMPTEVELKAAFRDDQTKASFRFLGLNPQAFESKVDVNNEDALKKYYSEHIEEYRTKKSVAFTSVVFAPADFTSAVEVTDDDIKEYYEANPEDFSEPKEVKLRKMLFKIKPSAGSSEVEKLMGTAPADDNAKEKAAAKDNAKKARDRLEAGEEFAEVAKQVSEDAGTAASGGDLGWLLYPALEDKLRQSASTLEVGEWSTPLETKDGFVLLYVEDKKDNVLKPFDTVRGEIEKKLRDADAPDYAHAAAFAFLEDWQEKDSSSSVPLTDFAKEKNKTAVQTEKPLAAGESSAQITSELSKKAAALSEGQRDLVEAGPLTYVVEITKTLPASLPEFEQVKDAVREAYRKAEAAALAKKAAEESLTQLRGEKGADGTVQKKTLAEIAAGIGGTVETTEPATKTTATGPLFLAPDAKRVAFALSKDRPIADELITAGQTYYLVELADKIAPPENEFDSKKAELKKQQITEGGTRLFDSLMKTLRGRYDVWVNPHLLEKKDSGW